MMERAQMNDRLVNEIRETLIDAIELGDLHLLRNLLAKEVFVNYKNLLYTPVSNTRRTALAEAARIGSLEIVQELAPYYVNAGSLKSGFPLHTACHSGALHVVEFLVKSFPRFLNVKDYECSLLPIQIASGFDDVTLARILLEAGASVDQTCIRYNNNDYYDPPAFNGKLDDITKYPGRFPALFLGLWHDCPKALATLLEHGASTILQVKENQDSYMKEVTQAVDNRICAFSVAAFRGSSNALEVLLDHATLSESAATRALYVAGINGNYECLWTLLEYGSPAPIIKEYSEDEQWKIWCTVIMNGKGPKSFPIQTMEVLVKCGTPLEPLAAQESDAFCDMLIDVHQSFLKWLFKCGLLELRYSRKGQRESGEARRALIRHDCLSLIKCFIYYQQDLKLIHIIKYFPIVLKIPPRLRSLSTLRIVPDDDISTPLYNYKHPELNQRVANAVENVSMKPLDEISKVSSLLRICRWAVRSQIVTKYGFVTQEVLAELQIPTSLRSYLLLDPNHT